MKKRLMVCLFVMLMAQSFAVPVMAVDVSTVVVDAAEVDMLDVGITPFNEMTRIYYRWAPHNPQRLQFRVWSVTNGRWITDWLYIN